MLLSIAMIVKNEEKHLEECLKALKPLQKHLKAEIVLVDTGSTDNTLNIAKKYADKIYEVEWNGNFADMRNISISKCSGQWIMIVDGDEILNNSYEIISFFKSGIYKKFKAGMLEIRNFTNTNNKLAEEKYAIAYLVRLFKKREEYRLYRNRLYRSHIRSFFICKSEKVRTGFYDIAGIEAACKRVEGSCCSSLSGRTRK